MDFLVRVEMSYLGVATANETGLVFPIAEKLPTVYRIRSGQSVYIGESANLYRRFGGFRRPGGSETTLVPRTNRRVQRWLLEEIQGLGSTPSIELCTQALVETGAVSTRLNLGEKEHRLLVENLLIFDEKKAGHRLINL